MKKKSAFLCLVLCFVIGISGILCVPAMAATDHRVLVLADRSVDMEAFETLYGTSSYFGGVRSEYYECGDKIVLTLEFHFFRTNEEWNHKEIAQISQIPGVISFKQWGFNDGTGDADGDGKVTTADALLCLQIAVGKREITDIGEYCDSLFRPNMVSLDIMIPQTSDALRILQKAVGIQ